MAESKSAAVPLGYAPTDALLISLIWRAFKGRSGSGGKKQCNQAPQGPCGRNGADEMGLDVMRRPPCRSALHRRCITVLTVDHRADHLLAASLRHDPRPFDKWRLVAYVLAMSADKNGDEITGHVLIEFDNRLLQTRSAKLPPVGWPQSRSTIASLCRRGRFRTVDDGPVSRRLTCTLRLTCPSRQSCSP